MAQSSFYHPFPTGAANWVYRYYDDLHFPTTIFTPYSLTGDTTISNISYKKVFKYSTYAGGLREDNKIIYFVPDTSQTEYLLYNFNLNIGDSIIHPYGGAVCTNDTVIVWNVDSVIVSDGYHRRFWFNSNAQWIEGIGAVYYLLEPCNVLCVSGNDVLECISTDSSLNYPNGYLSCVVSVTENGSLISQFDIKPNPFSINTTVSIGTEYMNSMVLISDIFGKVVRTFNVSGQNEFLLKRDNLKPGIYLIQLINSKGNTVSKKLIIE